MLTINITVTDQDTGAEVLCVTVQARHATLEPGERAQIGIEAVAEMLMGCAA